MTRREKMTQQYRDLVEEYVNVMTEEKGAYATIGGLQAFLGMVFFSLSEQEQLTELELMTATMKKYTQD